MAELSTQFAPTFEHHHPPPTNNWLLHEKMELPAAVTQIFPGFGHSASPNARTLNMAKKIPRQFGQWNPLATPVCLNMPLVLKEFLGPFLRKCNLKYSNFYSENV